MLRSLVVVVLSVLNTFCFAQNKEVDKGKRFLASMQLDSAKHYIDLATYHYEFNDGLETNITRGNVYYEIAISENPHFKKLHSNGLAVAARAYVESEELDKQFKYKFERKNKLDKIQALSLNKGVLFYQDQKYNEALQFFELAIYAGESIGEPSPKGYYFAGMSAEAKHSYDLAILYFKKCIQYDYRKAEMYRSILTICKEQKRDEEFLLVLEEAREYLPKSNELTMEEIRFLLRTNKAEKAQKLIEKAILEDPNNEVLFYQLGTIYTADRNTDKAVYYLNKALALKPDYYDALYNLGAMYYTQGAVAMRMARRVHDPRERTAIERGANDSFRNSIDPFKRALKVKPGDKTTMHSLQTVYKVLNMQKELDEITALLKG